LQNTSFETDENRMEGRETKRGREKKLYGDPSGGFVPSKGEGVKKRGSDGVAGIGSTRKRPVAVIMFARPGSRECRAQISSRRTGGISGVAGGIC